MCLGLALVLLAGAGCTVRQPAPSDWSATVVRSLGDAASDVATARLTLVRLRDGDLWSSYAVVVLAEAEKAVATAEETVSTLQPPEGRGREATRVLELIGAAVDAVRSARLVAAGDDAVPASLLRQLSRVVTRLEERSTRMSHR